MKTRKVVISWFSHSGAYPQFKKWGGGESRRARGMKHRRWSFFIFELKMASFGAFWELILLQLNCLSYTHKPVSKCLVKPAIVVYRCVQEVGRLLHDCPLGLKSGGHVPLSPGGYASAATDSWATDLLSETDNCWQLKITDNSMASDVVLRPSRLRHRFRKQSCSDVTSGHVAGSCPLFLGRTSLSARMPRDARDTKNKWPTRPAKQFSTT